MAPERLEKHRITHTHNQLDSLIEPCPLNIEELVRDGWHHRESHVDFPPDQELPLKDGQFLGQGISLGVYETTWKGHVLAVKKIALKRRSKQEMRVWRQQVEKEAESMKRLDHHHVIRLIGTYTHRDIFGLLLYPVATCDLATFLVDVDVFRKTFSGPPGKSPIGSDSFERLRLLGFDVSDSTTAIIQMRTRLYQMFPCLINALQYIHGQQIKHKDMKPSNVLIAPTCLWLTDFGVATDFSLRSRSLTDNGIRGTPRYFPPEVANYELCGRRSDIYSLGCIYIQIFWSSVVDRTMEEFDAHFLSEGHCSFRETLASIASWCQQYEREALGSLRDRRLLLEIKLMLKKDQNERPFAAEVAQALAVIDRLSDQSKGEHSMFLYCCAPEPSALLAIEEKNLTAQLVKRGFLVGESKEFTVESNVADIEDIEEGETVEMEKNQRRSTSIFSIGSRMSRLSMRSSWSRMWTSNPKEPSVARGTSQPYGAHMRRVYR